MFRSLALMGLLAATPALALAEEFNPQVSNCDGRSSAWNLAEPWEAHTRTFSNGKTRVAMIDTVEPAGGWAYLLILSPPYDELGIRQCVMIGNGGIGFSRMDFAALTADYDPAQGLIFTLPVGSYITGEGSDPVYDLQVVPNQATGDVTLRWPD